MDGFIHVSAPRTNLGNYCSALLSPVSGGWAEIEVPRGPNKSGPKSRSCSSTKPERVPLASSSVCVLWSFFLLFFYKGERLRCFCCSTSTFALVSWLRFLFWKGEDAFPHKMQTNSREVCWAACSFSVLQSTDKDRCVSPWDSCSLQTNSRVVCWAAWAQAPIVFQLTVDCCPEFLGLLFSAL